MTGMTTGKETETMSQEYDKMMRQFADKYRHVCVANNSIDAKLFEQYGVKRGLRDKNGKGVLSGITNISLPRPDCCPPRRAVPKGRFPRSAASARAGAVAGASGDFAD